MQITQISEREREKKHKPAKEVVLRKLYISLIEFHSDINKNVLENMFIMYLTDEIILIISI